MHKKLRFAWLILLALVPCPSLPAQDLKAHLEGDRLHVAAPELRFLDGRVLERLRNGAAVPFTVHLSAAPGLGARAVSQVTARFVLSFDLWEERFSVVETNSSRRSASHLSSAAAESWCIESVSLPVSALAGGKPLVLKLEIRAEESGEASESENSPGLSMAGLIDIFSRKAREQPSRWSAVSAPFRLADLKQKNGNRPRQ